MREDEESSECQPQPCLRERRVGRINCRAYEECGRPKPKKRAAEAAQVEELQGGKDACGLPRQDPQGSELRDRLRRVLDDLTSREVIALEPERARPQGRGPSG